jgi:hypothetical protein
MIKSVLGATIGRLFGDRAYWAAKLQDHRWISELDQRMGRSFDWTLDAVDTGDVLKIKELWLFCPPNSVSPLGNTARLPITEPGTAFQFKVASVDGFLDGMERKVESQIIGRVDDKATGACTCFIWDAQLRVLSTPWQSNIHSFGSWREGIAKIGALSPQVLGVRL